MSEDFNDPKEESKTQRKQRMLALQKLGERLVKLTTHQLHQLQLDPSLQQAITAAQAITQREAKRRQLQYIGRLMRDIDPEPIIAQLNALLQPSFQAKAQFQHIERWRDRLIAEDRSALEDFFNEFPEVDRQHVRQLVKNAKAKPQAARALFQYLREVLGG